MTFRKNLTNYSVVPQKIMQISWLKMILKCIIIVRGDVMASKNIRVSEETMIYLKELSKKANTSMQDIVEKAVEDYRRNRILEETNEAFLKLRNNSKAWQEEQRERKAWEATIGDNQ